jgi:uncharacterized protein
MIATRVWSLLLITLLTGCATSPTPRFYSLSSEAPNGGVGATSALPSIAITAITLPDTADRPQLAVRHGTHEVLMTQQHRWAQPLKLDLPRVIAENLSRLLDNPSVAAYPQSAALNADYRLALDFQRFDAAHATETVLEVLWTVRAANGSHNKRGRISVREPALDDTAQALVASYSRGLLRVSAQLASELAQLPLLAR